MTQCALASALIRSDDASIVNAAAKDKRALSRLLSLTYAADELIGGRAVKALVEAHGGKIWAESALPQGQGATFVVELPVTHTRIKPFSSL